MKKINIIIYIIILTFYYNLYGRTVGDFPERIISLGPAITENLYLLGVGDRLVANTVYCQRPPEGKNKEKIGTVIKADIEKVMVLKPDLILATSLTGSDQIEKMRSLGLRVEIFPQLESFSQICGQFLELGKLVGKAKESGGIINQIKEKVDNIKRNTRDLPKPRVFVQIGAKPLFTINKNSFLNDFIEFAGGINIASQAKTGLYSREEVLKSNTEVIIIVTMGIVGEKEKEIWQQFKTLNAVKNNRIHIMDSYKVCSPTPESFLDALEELVGFLHRETDMPASWYKNECK